MLPALLPCPSSRWLMLHVWCVHGLQGAHPLYTEREERELQLLMASKRHEVEAEVWRKYFGSRMVTEKGQVWHAPHSLREKDILPFCSLAGEQGRCPSTAVVPWLGAGQGLLPVCCPGRRNCPQGPRLEHAAGCGMGCLLCALSVREQHHCLASSKPGLCKAHALAEALRVAPAMGGSALGESPLPLQTSCPYVFEDPYRPSHVLRKAYAQKLKEMGQSTARQSTSEQEAELRLLKKVLEE